MGLGGLFDGFSGFFGDLFGGGVQGVQQGAQQSLASDFGDLNSLATGLPALGNRMDTQNAPPSMASILGGFGTTPTNQDPSQKSLLGDILTSMVGPTIMGTFGAIANTQQGNRQDEYMNQQLEMERERLGLTREQMAQAMEIAKANIKLKKKQLLLEAYANATQAALRGGESASASLSNAAQLQRVK